MEKKKNNRTANPRKLSKSEVKIWASSGTPRKPYYSVGVAERPWIPSARISCPPLEFGHDDKRHRARVQAQTSERCEKQVMAFKCIRQLHAMNTGMNTLCTRWRTCASPSSLDPCPHTRTGPGYTAACRAPRALSSGKDTSCSSIRPSIMLSRAPRFFISSSIDLCSARTHTSLFPSLSDVRVCGPSSLLASHLAAASSYAQEPYNVSLLFCVQLTETFEYERKSGFLV